MTDIAMFVGTAMMLVVVVFVLGLIVIFGTLLVREMWREERKALLWFLAYVAWVVAGLVLIGIGRGTIGV